MTRLCALLLSIGLVGLAASQEPQKPAVDKKSDAKKEPAKAEAPPPEGELDVHKTAERIADNAQKAGDRLKEKDPGADTRKIQTEIIKDIDALIRKAQEPPPPPMGSDMPPPMSDMMPPPMGGGGMQPKGPMNMGGGPQPKSPTGMGGSGADSKPKMGGGGGTGTDSKSGRRPPRQRKPRGESPMDSGRAGGTDPVPAKIDPKGTRTGTTKDDPTGEQMGDRFGKTSPKRQNDKLADLYKDVWGHLPDRLRQEMDLYYREQFMPRYSELLRQYYAALAEQRKKGPEDR
jgi:hypothetical protein